MYNIPSLLPHSKEMVLVDNVLEVNETHIITISQVRENNSFLLDGVLPTYCLIEIMAQSLGVWRGLSDTKSGNKLGFVLGTRGFKIYRPLISVGECIYTKVVISTQDVSGVGIYECESSDESGNMIATAKLTALNPSQSMLEQIKNGAING